MKTTLIVVLMMTFVSHGGSVKKKKGNHSSTATVVAVDSIEIYWRTPFTVSKPSYAESRTISVKGRTLVVQLEGEIMARFLLDRDGDMKEDTILRAPFRFQKKGDLFIIPTPFRFAKANRLKDGCFLAKNSLFSIIETL